MIKCVGALIYDTKKKMFLLQQRSSKSSHPLKWGLWGGKLERGESFNEGLIRELTEELTVLPTIDDFYYLDTYLSKDNKFIYYSCLIITHDFDNFNITSESNDFVWLPLEYIQKIDLHYGTRITIRNKYNLIKDLIIQQ